MAFGSLYDSLSSINIMMIHSSPACPRTKKERGVTGLLVAVRAFLFVLAVRVAVLFFSQGAEP